MASQVIMPKMGYDMTAGTLARWLKHPGDPVTVGDRLAEVETDKVTIEIEAFVNGTIGRLLVDEGERVPVGHAIAEIETPSPTPGLTEPEPIGAGEGGEALPEREHAGAGVAALGGVRTGPERHAGAEPRPWPPPQAGGTMPGAVSGPPETPQRPKASPVARRIAQSEGIDLRSLSGTGPGGRIVKADVEARLRGHPAPPAVREAPPPAPPTLPAAPARQPEAVVRAMQASKRTIPHFYLTVPVDMGPALALRAALNAQQPDDRRISIPALIIKAVALALPAVPGLCQIWTEEGPQPANRPHIAIAVSLPEGGIVSPVIHDAARLPLVALAWLSRRLIREARSGKLGSASLQGGVFTVSSLGGAGVESVAAIITPPQSGVLAVGAIRSEPVARDNGIIVAQRLRMTLSADHRLIGGIEGATFLKGVRERLESPYRLLTEGYEEG